MRRCVSERAPTPNSDKGSSQCCPQQFGGATLEILQRGPHCPATRLCKGTERKFDASPKLNRAAARRAEGKLVVYNHDIWCDWGGGWLNIQGKVCLHNVGIE